jgi:hypothetical protein
MSNFNASLQPPHVGGQVFCLAAALSAGKQARQGLLLFLLQYQKFLFVDFAGVCIRVCIRN